jgi:hypothetical protein
MATTSSTSSGGPLSLRDRFADINRNVGLTVPQAEVPNPASDINQAIQNSVPNVFNIDVPKRGGLTEALDTAPVASMADVSRATGSRFVPGAEVMLDANGNPIVDEMGQKQYRQLTPEDYQMEQTQQLAAAPNFQEAFGDIQENGVLDTQGAIEGVLNLTSERATINTPAREQSKLLSGFSSQEDIASYADQSQADFKKLAYNAMDNLFDFDKATATVKVNGEKVPAGVAAIVNQEGEEGYQPYIEKYGIPLATLSGLALSQSLNQIRQDGIASASYTPTSLNGSSIDDMNALSTLIDSVDHFISDNAQKSGIPLSKEAASTIARGQVASAYNDGSIIPYMDPKSSKIHFFGNPKAKEAARGLQRLADAVRQTLSYRLPSRTPNPGGTSFIKGTPQVSENSPKGLDIVTDAAELTKTYMGSMNFAFLADNVKAKQLWLDDIIANAVKDNKGRIKWSTSVYAKRHKVSESDYQAVHDNTDPDQGFDANVPGSLQKYKEAQVEQAVDVIDTKIKALQFDILNANTLMGRSNYSEWKHALANQRFFPASAGVDYMGSKTGTRDMLTFADKDFIKDTNLLLDDTKSEELIARAVKIFQKAGPEQHAALLALKPEELAAIGTMVNATINYYTAVSANPEPNIIKYAPADIIQRYTPAIARKLADVGNEYKAWLQNPEGQHDNIVGLMAAIEPGEATGNTNLWADMAEIVNPLNKGKTIYLSHNSFDDGNQNGIFLQSLFFGSFKNADRLGTFNPKLADMREYAFKELKKILLDDLRTDNPELANAFDSVFNKLIKDNGLAKVAKDFMKAPLMQTSYGKDASMFGAQVTEFMDSLPGDLRRNLMDSTGSESSNFANKQLTKALESTLRKVVQSNYANILKSFGRYTAILNTSVIVPGPTGDHWILTPAGVTPVVSKGDPGVVWEHTLEDGSRVAIRAPNYETESISSGDQDFNLVQTQRGLKPTATKGQQVFFDRYKQKYDYFDNAIGTAQQRFMVVMPVQSLDGDLVKMTTLFVNKGREKKAPYPAAWVHDSIISNAGSSLIYRNAYNNIAIPSSVDYISKFPKMLDDYLKRAEDAVMRKASMNDYVGIGEMGEFPALGAYFDEIFDKLKPGGSYEQYYLSGYTDAQWQKRKANMQEVLDEAKKYGWKPSALFTNTIGKDGSIRQAAELHKQLVVKVSQFKQLANLAKRELKLDGVNNDLSRWASEAPRSVKETFEHLLRSAGPNRIAQMTYGGGNPKADISNYKAQQEAKDIARDESFVSAYEKSFGDDFIVGKPMMDVPKPESGTGFIPSFQMRENPNKGKVKGAFEISNKKTSRDVQLESSYPNISNITGTMKYLKKINGNDTLSLNSFKDLVKLLDNNSSIDRSPADRNTDINKFNSIKEEVTKLSKLVGY